MRLTYQVLGLITLAGPLVLGCGDGTGLGDRAPISVTLQQASSAAAAPVLQIMSPQGATGVIALSDVDSLDVRVTRVEALPVASEKDSANDAAWQPVEVVGNGLLTLVKRPTATQGALVLATDSIPRANWPCR